MHSNKLVFCTLLNILYDFILQWQGYQSVYVGCSASLESFDLTWLELQCGFGSTIHNVSVAFCKTLVLLWCRCCSFVLCILDSFPFRWLMCSDATWSLFLFSGVVLQYLSVVSMVFLNYQPNHFTTLTIFA